MTTARTFLKIGAAGATAVALSVAGLATVGAPAQATSGSLLYTCTVGGLAGTHEFSAVVDTNAPATLTPGQTVDISTTATVVVPDSVTNSIRGADGVEVDGTASFKTTVDGVERTTAMTFPRTAVPPVPGEPFLTVVATGPSGSITAGNAGTAVLVAAKDFTITIVGWDASNLTLGNWPATCTQQASQNNLADTVNVVPTPTTTTLTVDPSPLEFGAAPTASVDVTVSGSNAKPAGKVAFTFEGKTVTVDVKGGKAKATLAAASVMGSRPVTAVFTPTDPNLAVSEATKNVTVVKDQTTTTASLVYRAAKHRLVGKAVVASQHGTAVDGVVKFVLKRDGVKLRSVLVELNKFDKAKKVFKNISKHGTYLVVTRYLGSPTLKRSVDRVKVVV